MTVAVIMVAPLMALATNFPPKPQQLVNDNANMMTAEDRAALEAELRAYNTKTSNEIAVLTVPSLDGLDVDDYANQLFHEWGVGKKGSDNGVLLLFAPTEKKVRIEVGYGLEGALNDARAGDIIRGVIHPLYESGNRSGSVVKGAEAVMIVLGDTPYPSRAAQTSSGDDSSLVVFLSCGAGFGLLILLIVVILRRRGNPASMVEEDNYHEDVGLEDDASYVRRGVIPIHERTCPREQSYSHASQALRRRDDDDSSGSAAAFVAGAAIASSHEDDPSPSSDDGGSSFDFGGGDSGGGGASGDL